MTLVVILRNTVCVNWNEDILDAVEIAISVIGKLENFGASARYSFPTLTLQYSSTKLWRPIHWGQANFLNSFYPGERNETVTIIPSRKFVHLQFTSSSFHCSRSWSGLNRQSNHEVETNLFTGSLFSTTLLKSVLLKFPFLCFNYLLIARKYLSELYCKKKLDGNTTTKMSITEGKSKTQPL